MDSSAPPGDEIPVNGEQSSDYERRQQTRVPLELWTEEILGEDIYYRRTGNVSEGGVYFEHALPHPLGTEVTLKFALPGDAEMVVARGEVVNVASQSGGLGMGVKFVHVEGNGRERIREHIRRNLPKSDTSLR